METSTRNRIIHFSMLTTLVGGIYRANASSTTCIPHPCIEQFTTTCWAKIINRRNVHAVHTQSTITYANPTVVRANSMTGVAKSTSIFEEFQNSNWGHPLENCQVTLKCFGKKMQRSVKYYSSDVEKCCLTQTKNLKHKNLIEAKI